LRELFPLCPVSCRPMAPDRSGRKHPSGGTRQVIAPVSPGGSSSESAAAALTAADAGNRTSCHPGSPRDAEPGKQHKPSPHSPPPAPLPTHPRSCTRDSHQASGVSCRVVRPVPVRGAPPARHIPTYACGIQDKTGANPCVSEEESPSKHGCGPSPWVPATPTATGDHRVRVRFAPGRLQARRVAMGTGDADGNR
jgi:hypothetical protein